VAFADLPDRYGRGFGVVNLSQMKVFYLAWPILQTPSAEFLLTGLAAGFPFPWSAYVRLLEVKDAHARALDLQKEIVAEIKGYEEEIRNYELQIKNCRDKIAKAVNKVWEIGEE